MQYFYTTFATSSQITTNVFASSLLITNNTTCLC